MARTRSPNPLTTGAIGAAAGAVIGGATTVLLTNKKARKIVASKLEDLGEYAQEAMTVVSDVAKDAQMARVRYAGIKGGKTRKSRKMKR